MKRTMVAALTCLALTTSSFTAWAHSPNDTAEHKLKSLVGESSLIVYGRVTNIVYKNSEPTKEQPKGIPHTFVTYQIMETLRGKTPDERLTLRIPGGSDGQGGMYLVTSAPAFARGQTDVLFVKGGKETDCPLVECVEGRFRVHENQVFNAWGIPVVDVQKTLRIGGKPRFDLNVMEVPRPSFETLLQRPEIRKQLDMLQRRSSQSLKELRARYEQEAPKYSVVKYGVQMDPSRKDLTENDEASAMTTYDAPLSLDRFIEGIREWSARMGTPQIPIAMANPKERFSVPDPRLMPLDAERALSPKVSNEERYDIRAKEEQE
ncbi:hypothetical protein [Nitrospira sp. M1]